MTLQIARKVQKGVFPLVNLSQKINLTPTALTNDNATHEKTSSVTQDKNIIDTKHETSQNKLTSLRSENDSNTLVEKVENNNK